MKKIFLFSCILLCYGLSFSQNVSINANGDPADPSAMLDINSPNKGILIPRMPTEQRVLIASPAQGLMVFDTDTHSFWFYSNGWNEIGAGGVNNGPASGDLSGNYPSPNVVKIQNLDVASGIPFDKQILKWDAINNNWKGRNDSLFLPYNVSFGNPTKLFGITNTNTTNGASAIYGKSGNAGSGIIPGTTMGVWGDNSNGLGVVGTSNTGIGSYGLSFGNHGVYGYSTVAAFAGVCGANANAGGYGVFGSIQNSGIGVYGKSTGTAGLAGQFEIQNIANFDPALKGITNGHGPAGYFTTSGTSSHAGYFSSTNAANNYPAVFIDNTSSGTGLSVSQSPANTTYGIYVNGQGSGASIYSLSELGRAGVFGIYNSSNTNNSFEASTVGRGRAGSFLKNNTTGSVSDVHEPAVLIDNNSKGNALKIISLHSPSVNSGIDVNYDGQNFGINVGSTHGGIHALSQSAAGSAVLAENYAGGFAIKGYSNASLQAAIHAENSHMFGIGVKAVTTGSQSVAIQGTANSNAAAVEGVNSGGGFAIRGYCNTGAGEVGYGVKGETNSVSWGIPGQFISNCPDAITNTLWLIDNSKGETFRVQVNNDMNNSDAIHVEHGGTGKLASFNHNSSEKLSINNNGNVISAGTVTVKGNKGIVRSSSATQMRMESVSSPTVASANLGVGGSVSVSINFSSAFSSPPTVSVANINSGFSGPCDALSVSIKDVTTTGCTLRVFNTYMSSTGAFSGTWKLMVMGAE